MTDWLMVSSHGVIWSTLIALMGGVRFHIRFERNGSITPKLRFRIWIDRGKGNR